MDEKDWPKTVEEAADVVISWWSDEDREKFKDWPKEKLIAFHHGLGTAIRNEFGLWNENIELISAYAKAKGCMGEHGVYYPPVEADDISMEIIEIAWRKLQSGG